MPPFSEYLNTPLRVNFDSPQYLISANYSLLSAYMAGYNRATCTDKNRLFQVIRSCFAISVLTSLPRYFLVWKNLEPLSHV